MTINIYNIKGNRIKTLESGFKQAGTYTNSWNGENSHGIKMPSGVYFIEVKNSNINDVIKVTLLK